MQSLTKRASTSKASPNKNEASEQGVRPPAGRPGNLTSQQEDVLREFRSQLEEQDLLSADDSIGTSDSTLCRFLRARQFRLDKSMSMFRDCQHWRKHCFAGKSMDQLYEEIDPFDFDKKPDIFKYWPMCFHGVDKLQRPINYQKFGSISTKQLYSVATPEYHWKTVLVNCEALPREVLPAASRAANRVIDSALCIVDLEGFSLSQFWDMKDLAKASFSVSQDRYPETMGRVVIINAPSSFSYIWSAIKNWLAPETRQKVEVLGRDYHRTLLNDVDADQLPAELGGQCHCPEGCMLSSKGPWKHDRSGHREEGIMDDRLVEKTDRPAPHANGNGAGAGSARSPQPSPRMGQPGTSAPAPAPAAVAAAGGQANGVAAAPPTPFLDAQPATPGQLDAARDGDREPSIQHVES